MKTPPSLTHFPRLSRHHRSRLSRHHGASRSFRLSGHHGACSRGALIALLILLSAFSLPHCSFAQRTNALKCYTGNVDDLPVDHKAWSRSDWIVTFYAQDGTILDLDGHTPITMGVKTALDETTFFAYTTGTVVEADQGTALFQLDGNNWGTNITTDTTMYGGFRLTSYDNPLTTLDIRLKPSVNTGTETYAAPSNWAIETNSLSSGLVRVLNFTTGFSFVTSGDELEIQVPWLAGDTTLSNSITTWVQSQGYVTNAITLDSAAFTNGVRAAQTNDGYEADTDTTYTDDLPAFTNAVRAAQTNDGYEADTTYTDDLPAFTNAVRAAQTNDGYEADTRLDDGTPATNDVNMGSQSITNVQLVAANDNTVGGNSGSNLVIRAGKSALMPEAPSLTLAGGGSDSGQGDATLRAGGGAAATASANVRLEGGYGFAWSGTRGNIYLTPGSNSLDDATGHVLVTGGNSNNPPFKVKPTYGGNTVAAQLFGSLQIVDTQTNAFVTIYPDGRMVLGTNSITIDPIAGYIDVDNGSVSNATYHGDGAGITNLTLSGLAQDPAMGSYQGAREDLGGTNALTWLPTKYAGKWTPTASSTFAMSTDTTYPRATYSLWLYSTNTITFDAEIELQNTITATGTNLWVIGPSDTATNWVAVGRAF